jgi:hypothetical protein
MRESVRQRREERPMLDTETTRGYAVGWGTLALINAGLAQAKGRSRLIWFLLSLPLGPLATLAVVLVDPIRKPASTAERSK